MSILNLPPSICLLNLRVLSLSLVKFVQSISLQELFSLPVLVELALHYCNWKDLKILNISAPKLWKLSVVNCSTDDNSPNKFQLLIDGSCLRYFEFRGFLNYDISISAASLLSSATVDIQCLYYRYQGELLCHHPLKFLMGLINSRYLSLSFIAIELGIDHNGPEIQALYRSSEFFGALPLFCNLTGLVLSERKFSFDCEAPFAILTKFPHLERITFYQGIELKRKRENYSWILYPFPLCLVNLKEIEISNFDHVKGEMIVLRELLTAATLLKKLVIEGSYSFRKLQIDRQGVVDELKALLAWSEDCTIVFKPTLDDAVAIFIRKHL